MNKPTDVAADNLAHRTNAPELAPKARVKVVKRQTTRRSNKATVSTANGVGDGLVHSPLMISPCMDALPISLQALSPSVPSQGATGPQLNNHFAFPRSPLDRDAETSPLKLLEIKGSSANFERALRYVRQRCQADDRLQSIITPLAPAADAI